MSSNKEVSSISTIEKKDIVYIVSSQFSDYKEDPGYSQIFAFRDEEKARNFMKDRAKRLFYNYIHVEGETVCEDREESEDGSEESNDDSEESNDDSEESNDDSEESNDDSEKPEEDPKPIREKHPPKKAEVLAITTFMKV